MKVVRSTKNKDGTISVTIRLAPTETALLRHGVAREIKSELVEINPDHHYRLGGQVDDIVASHVITEAAPVVWCSIEQKWLEV
jgi:hypothetical protein